VIDIVFAAVILVFFGLCLSFADLCERI